MPSAAAVAEIVALVGEPTRAVMLAALMNRRALTDAESATIAGVTPRTASGHLGRLAKSFGIKRPDRARRRNRASAFCPS